MEKKYVALIVIAILAGTAIAGTSVASMYHDMFSNANCEEYNTGHGFIWLPRSVSDIFQGDTVIIHFVSMTNDELVVNGKVVSGAIYPIKCGRADDYDYELWMGVWNAFELATSEKPVTTFVRLWRSGQITIIPNGEENALKLLEAEENENVREDAEPVPQYIREGFEELATGSN